MEFAQRLALLLEEKGVSRGKLARAAGVHTSTVTNWINGKKPTIDNLISVAEFFGVPISFLTDDTNISENILEQKEKPTTENGSGQSEIDFIFSQLTPANQTKLLELARLYLDHQRKTEENL